MEKVKKFRSLKWALMKYVPICVMIAIIGASLIGFGTNDLQDWYTEKYGVYNDDIVFVMKEYNGSMVIINSDEHVKFTKETANLYMIYWIICYAQCILIPLWIFGCVAVTGAIFYKRELKKPITILLDASQKIADNQLDFQIEYNKKNELGTLCNAFEEMRCQLDKNNREMWRSLEERKRLNSAFSHDLRTPLTVLKGYAEFLEKYVPDGKISEEKMMSVLAMMNGQITRLEHYTQKMHAVQKLEDIAPDEKEISSKQLFSMLDETGNAICREKFFCHYFSDQKMIFVDTELVMQVYENLIANAVRYADSSVEMECTVSDEMLRITVKDDGKGFSEQALKNAVQPFFRDEKESDKLHFGLGLYICRMICGKCGGNLTVENHDHGGKVTAEFLCKSFCESR